MNAFGDAVRECDELSAELDVLSDSIASITDVGAAEVQSLAARGEAAQGRLELLLNATRKLVQKARLPPERRLLNATRCSDIEALALRLPPMQSQLAESRGVVAALVAEEAVVAEEAAKMAEAEAKKAAKMAEAEAKAAAERAEAEAKAAAEAEANAAVERAEAEAKAAAERAEAEAKAAAERNKAEGKGATSPEAVKVKLVHSRYAGRTLLLEGMAGAPARAVALEVATMVPDLPADRAVLVAGGRLLRGDAPVPDAVVLHVGVAPSLEEAAAAAVGPLPAPAASLCNGPGDVRDAKEVATAMAAAFATMRASVGYDPLIEAVNTIVKALEHVIRRSAGPWRACLACIGSRVPQAARGEVSRDQGE